jgi:hypothetical protein
MAAAVCAPPDIAFGVPQHSFRRELSVEVRVPLRGDLGIGVGEIVPVVRSRLVGSAIRAAVVQEEQRPDPWCVAVRALEAVGLQSSADDGDAARVSVVGPCGSQGGYIGN